MRSTLPVSARDLARAAGRPGEVLRRSEASTGFRTGQAVWLKGRAASFCYEVEPGTVVIRYASETMTRVVPLRKLAAAPPTGEPQIR